MNHFSNVQTANFNKNFLAYYNLVLMFIVLTIISIGYDTTVNIKVIAKIQCYN